MSPRLAGGGGGLLVKVIPALGNGVLSCSPERKHLYCKMFVVQCVVVYPGANEKSQPAYITTQMKSSKLKNSKPYG